MIIIFKGKWLFKWTTCSDKPNGIYIWISESGAHGVHFPQGHASCISTIQLRGDISHTCVYIYVYIIMCILCIGI